MKKIWKEWAVEHIARTGMCPGDPSFGLPTDSLTREEFDLAVKSKGCHKYNDCHFVPEVLGAAPDLKEVKIEAQPKDSPTLQQDVQDVMRSKRLAKLRENLHIYVDRIHFKDSGALSVPEHLLNLSEYIKLSL